MRYSFETTQWLPYAVPRVFGFFANPGNLPRLMPAWQRGRIDGLTIVPPPPAPADAQGASAAGAGTRMMFSFRPVPLAPLRLAWEAEITEFAWHDHFCDTQLRGPFAWWRHCHRVRPETRDGVDGTLLTDHIVYEPPFGPLGALANALVLRRQIQGAFAFRQRRTAELLASERT